MPEKTASPYPDAIVVSTICFGWFILSSLQAVASGFPTRPFTDSALLEIIALEGVLAATALAYLRARGYALGQLVAVPSANGCLVGLLLYLASMLLSSPLWALFGTADSVSQPIEEMVTGATISFLPLVALSVVNGLYEETFLLGYLQRSLDRSGALFAIGLPLLVRVLYHLYQGPAGAASVIGFGIVLGVYFRWRRDLWSVVFAHIFADIAAFSMN